MKLLGLGYVGLNAPDASAWESFGVEAVGLMPARSQPPGHEDDGTVFLKMDERLYRIAVHPSKEMGLGYMGFELAGPTELEAAIEEVHNSGVAIDRGSEPDAQARGVAELAFFRDPMGNRVELFYGQSADYNFQSPANVRAFKTGNLGMGHCLLFVPDIRQATSFYMGVLGFRLSDFTAGGKIQFLHCTPRHHTLALAELGGANGIHHVMLEMEDLDDVGRALDRTRSQGVPITADLGRHTNDQAVSFYAGSPSEMSVEVGWGARLIDDNDWSPVQFGGDPWGHHGLRESIRELAAKIEERTAG